MVIDSDGKQLGALPTREGISLASEQGLDLVEVAPLLTPPVCKIMDYGKSSISRIKNIHPNRRM